MAPSEPWAMAIAAPAGYGYMATMEYTLLETYYATPPYANGGKYLATAHLLTNSASAECEVLSQQEQPPPQGSITIFQSPVTPCAVCSVITFTLRTNDGYNGYSLVAADWSGSGVPDNTTNTATCSVGPIGPGTNFHVYAHVGTNAVYTNIYATYADDLQTLSCSGVVVTNENKTLYIASGDQPAVTAVKFCGICPWDNWFSGPVSNQHVPPNATNRLEGNLELPGPGTYNVSVSKGGKTLTLNVSGIKVCMTAYRPTTEGPSYGSPFAKHAVPDGQEENPGAGIRVNGDDDNINSTPDRSDTSVNGENDLIEVELKSEPYPTPAGVTNILKRSNSNIKVWASHTKGTAILNSGTETAITFSASTRTVWVECTNSGAADLELIARANGSDLYSDKVHFYPFTSIVIALGGEDQVPTDPVTPALPDTSHPGVFEFGRDLYLAGYDVHMYDEDNVNSEGAGATYNEVTNAIQRRSVSQVAILGYSHGGGSTYDLAERLDSNRATIGTFTIPFTAYIDAVENDSDADMDQEHKRPPGTNYHVNYYQEGVANPLDPDFDWGLDGGPTDTPGADHEVDVDSPTPTETHYTVDDEATILDGIETRLTPRVTR